MTGLCEEFLSIPGVEYALTSNGAAVYRLKDNQAIYTNYLDTDLAAELMERMLPLELMATFFADGQGYAVQQQMSLLPRLPLDEPIKAYLRSSRKLLEDPVAFIRQHLSLIHICPPGKLRRPQAGSVTVQSLWRLKVSLADTSSSTLAPLTITET